MIDNQLIERLRCIACHGEVEVQGAELRCKQCQKVYPIVSGVPVLLERKSSEHGLDYQSPSSVS